MTAIVVTLGVIVLAAFARDAHIRQLAARPVAAPQNDARLDAIENDVASLKRTVGVLTEGRKR